MSRRITVATSLLALALAWGCATDPEEVGAGGAPDGGTPGSGGALDSAGGARGSGGSALPGAGGRADADAGGGASSAGGARVVGDAGSDAGDLPDATSEEAGAGGSPSAGGRSGAGGRRGAGGSAAAGGRAGAGGLAGSGGASSSGGAAGAGGSGSGGAGEAVTYGPTYTGGQFHLGPVDWEESQWHNACAPLTGYAPAIRSLEGDLLAGLWNGIPNVSELCDACIRVTTAQGKSALLRVITYGDTTTNSIDVSPAAHALLDSGEYPRLMSWQLAKCPDTGPIVYEFQTGSSQWWTSLWVRNARVPLSEVAVRSANHPSFVPLARSSDGTLNDASGFGQGSFTLRLTGVDGSVHTDTFAWPAGGVAGVTLTGSGNFE
jgi:expansin (peptidoglycan-binding protein)